MIPPVETKLITSIIANLIVKKRNTRKLIKYINKLQGERDREITNSAVKRVRYNQVNTLTNTFFRTLSQLMKTSYALLFPSYKKK